MPKKLRILLWFLIGLFVASVTSIALFLTSVSPFRGEFKIETVTIAAKSQTPVRMTWRSFTCESGSGFERCTVPLPTGDLAVTVSYEGNYADNNWQILGCQATHAERKIACDGSLFGSSAGGVRFLGWIEVNTDLGLTSKQLQALRQENWFAQWDQNNPLWSLATAVFSIAFGLLFGLVLWQYPSRPVKTLTAIAVGLSSFSFFALAPLSFSRLVTSIGFSLGGEPNPGFPQLFSNYVMWLFTLFSGFYVFDDSGLIKFGIIGAIAAAGTLALLWRRTEPRMSPMFAILGGGSALLLFSLFANGFLIANGFVQADY